MRPTAFFKSLAGQIELVKQGKPYVMFGDGKLASCKPISERDLARFMADCITGARQAGRLAGRLRMHSQQASRLQQPVSEAASRRRAAGC